MVTAVGNPIRDLKALLQYALIEIQKIEEKQKEPLRIIRCPASGKFLCKAKGVFEIVDCKHCGQDHRFE